MGALSIAFDIIIIGALALPWVALVIHLFFSGDRSGIEHLLDWVKQQNQPAAAGVLLFAMAYFLGSAVSRMAQDFFNDDDLSIQVGHRLYVVVTENSIRTSAYCRMNKNYPADEALRDLTDDCDCMHHHGHPTLLYLIHSTPADQTKADRESKKLETRVLNLFHFQESALLLKGQDETERLRQLHDQVMVLKGVALDGLVAFSLLLFGWCATFSPKWRWRLSIAPLAYLLFGLLALRNHLSDRKLSDPPFLEFTLILLAVSGGCVLWRGTPVDRALQGEKDMTKDRRVDTECKAGFVLLSLVFAVMAFFGWWTTEVLYDEQVIYSHYALSQKPPN